MAPKWLTQLWFKMSRIALSTWIVSYCHKNNNFECTAEYWRTVILEQVIGIRLISVWWVKLYVSVTERLSWISCVPRQLLISFQTFLQSKFPVQKDFWFLIDVMVWNSYFVSLSHPMWKCVKVSSLSFLSLSSLNCRCHYIVRVHIIVSSEYNKTES